jgi:hypothetical protein
MSDDDIVQQRIAGKSVRAIAKAKDIALADVTATTALPNVADASKNTRTSYAPEGKAWISLYSHWQY